MPRCPTCGRDNEFIAVVHGLGKGKPHRHPCGRQANRRHEQEREQLLYLVRTISRGDQTAYTAHGRSPSPWRCLTSRSRSWPAVWGHHQAHLQLRRHRRVGHLPALPRRLQLRLRGRPPPTSTPPGALPAAGAELRQAWSGFSGQLRSAEATAPVTLNEPGLTTRAREYVEEKGLPFDEVTIYSCPDLGQATGKYKLLGHNIARDGLGLA